jgi:UDP-N-acetylmuramate--alanine ligase
MTALARARESTMPSPTQARLRPPPAAAARLGHAFPRRVHLLGAGGAGVSGLGRILAARGVRVSGHDRSDSAMLAGLRRETGERAHDFVLGDSRAEHLPAGVELVVRSAAVPNDDPQLCAALARGIPVWKYAEALGRLCPAGRTLAVAGTHGKTGSSWMLWHALEGINAHLGAPVTGALIGGTCRRLRTNALAGLEGGLFCVEACEYDRSFLQLAPLGAIVTNVEEDHLDYYGSFGAIKEAFARFTDRVAADGLLVLGREVPPEVEHAARASVWRLGRELEVELLGETRGAFCLRLLGPGWATPPVQLAIPGHFSVENAACALALAIGISARRARVDPGVLAAAGARGLVRFAGAERRFEPWGSVTGAAGTVHVVHDYAHHPTEVRVTLEAARRAYPRVPLFVLFQPHQHSRTARFLEDFAEALRRADHVVVADVYGARAHREGERRAGAADLVLALRSRGVSAQEGGGPGLSCERFAAALPDASAAFVIGAGDIEGIRESLLARLAARVPARR